MEVQVIEKVQGRIDRATGLQINRKLKVAAYARVSTDSEDQLNSFESQVKYYNEKITKNIEWSFVEVYADESISGTQDYKRSNFMRMIQDSMNGKIDLILTKSISRFARNTLDTLKYVRMLKEKNVAILFEEENINTLEMAGELLLTILSSVAQQESETISSHVKLGLKMKQQRGELIGYNGCLGYTYDKENKSISINQEEAEIVRYIFNRYAQGVGSSIIARELTNMKYLTPKGLTRWSDSTVRRILKNEKYKGDVLQGKTYTTDPITHKRVINMGEENQYYIKEHHTAIIEPELFDKVQQILEKRAGSRSKGKRRGNYSRKYPFSSRIYCGFCGTVLTRRNWNSKTKNETPVWHCMNFVKRGKQECPKCKAMRETVIENCFVDVYKILCSNKGDIVNKFITRINSIITENSSSKLIENIEIEKEKLKSKMNKLIDLSLENAIDRDIFLERKEKMQNQIEQLKLKQEKLAVEERNKTNRKLSLNKLKRYLENGKIITEFDKDAFEILVKQVIISGYDEKDKADPKQVTFVLKNESKINYEDYLQTRGDINQKSLQMSDHTCGVCNSDRAKIKHVILEFDMVSEIITFEEKGRFGKEKHQNLGVKVKVVADMVNGNT